MDGVISAAFEGVDLDGTSKKVHGFPLDKSAIAAVPMSCAVSWTLDGGADVLGSTADHPRRGPITVAVKFEERT